MAFKQALAVAAMEKAAGKIINKSLCEVPGGWLALAETEAGKRLVFASKEESQLSKMFVAENTATENGVNVAVMALTPNNAAVVRRFVKWASPSACGTKGTSIGFSDWVGAADAFAADLFAKRQLKPVLVDYTAENSAVLKRNFLEAVDTATWGILENGYKEGYGANAAGLKAEEDIVKALLYGYSMIGFDCSDKIDLSLEKLSDEEIEKRYNGLNDAFREALAASYLNVEFKVGTNTVKFTDAELRRIVLEYGEAIMHVQFIYNSYLKNTPWDIDFELSLSKPGKMLTPQEHYLIANELQRNNIKLASICLDGLMETEALHKDLQVHCEIADTFGYRLSFCNADLAQVDFATAVKFLKGKVHFKLTNVLWLAALQLIAEKNAELMGKIAAAAELEVAPAEELTAATEAGKAYALAYAKVLGPEVGNLSAEIKDYLLANQNEYATSVTKNVEIYLKKF
ncbi:MAG: hypothetical protein IJV92_03455 [Phascolarctobacterium sp.]|nr:hypothetical protein [Phascolarctobacterium sp.]